MRSRINRREWLRAAAVAGASLLVLRDSRSARGYFANEKLGVALVGLSGRGAWFVETVPRIGENVVALCDVNQQRAAEAFQKFPDVPKFQDFRKMLDERGTQIDAVFVATPDNTHAVISAAAMRAGKHVYCEKPLTHDVAEARARARDCSPAGRGHADGQPGDGHRGLSPGGGIDPGRLDRHDQGDPRLGRRRHADLARRRTAASRCPRGWTGTCGWARRRAAVPFPMATSGTAGGTSPRATRGTGGRTARNLPFKAIEIDSLWHADPATQPRIRVHVEMSEIERFGFPALGVDPLRDPGSRGDLPPIEFHHHYGAPEGRQRVEAHLGRQLDWGDAGERKWKEHGGCLIVGTEGHDQVDRAQLVVHAAARGQVRRLRGSAADAAPIREPRARVHGGLQGRAADDVEFRLRRRRWSSSSCWPTWPRSSARRWSSTRWRARSSTIPRPMPPCAASIARAGRCSCGRTICIRSVRGHRR